MIIAVSAAPSSVPATPKVDVTTAAVAEASPAAMTAAGAMIDCFFPRSLAASHPIITLTEFKGLRKSEVRHEKQIRKEDRGTPVLFGLVKGDGQHLNR